MNPKKLPKLDHISLEAWYEKYGDSPVASMYVANISQQQANLIFTVESSNGSSNIVSVPYTFAPLDLTVYITISQLVKAEGFRKLLQSRRLAILDNKQVVEEALTHPLVISELNRIFNVENSVDLENENSHTRQTEVDSLEEDQIANDPLVSNIMQLAFSEADEGRLVNLLHTQGDSLSDKSLEYLRKNSKNRTLSDFIIDKIDN